MKENLIRNVKMYQQSKQKSLTQKSLQTNTGKAFSSLDRGAVCGSRSRSVTGVGGPLLAELNLKHKEI